MIGDILHEIGSTVRNNKLRTALTGFAVSWGIFLLICLLGAGNGLMNAFMGDTDRFVQNSIQVFGGKTSLPANGYKEGRRIRLDQGDVDITLGNEFDEYVDMVAPVTSGVSTTLIAGSNTVAGYIEGVTPEIISIEKVVMRDGRFINPLDIQQRNKVAVISSNQDRELGGMLGKWVTMNGFSFKVVGIYEADESDYQSSVYLPYSTVKGIFDTSPEIGTLQFTFHGINTLQQSNEFEELYASRIKTHHEADPSDQNAIWIWNRFSQNIQMNQAASILNLALWILGILTLISGIVGVSNIMLSTVKERAHEFGIRKARGAKPGNILSLIITESVCITAVFGYIGMFLGMVACEVMDKTIGAKAVDIGFTQIHMLENPTVGLNVAIEATLLLIVAGTLAGLVPARKASKVRPIEALRAE